jgi:hypothetical protein
VCVAERHGSVKERGKNEMSNRKKTNTRGMLAGASRAACRSTQASLCHHTTGRRKKANVTQNFSTDQLRLVLGVHGQCQHFTSLCGVRYGATGIAMASQQTGLGGGGGGGGCV